MVLISTPSANLSVVYFDASCNCQLENLHQGYFGCVVLCRWVKQLLPAAPGGDRERSFDSVSLPVHGLRLQRCEPVLVKLLLPHGR